MIGFEGDNGNATGLRWLCARGLALALLLAACSGRPLQLPAEAPQESAGIVAEVVPAIEMMTPFSQEDETASLSDAALIEVGKDLYISNCAPCHQPNGEGNLSIFPALNRNAFVTVSDPTAVIDTVLHGRQLMPAFGVTLSAQEVAAVTSYIRNAWNNQAPVVDAAQVRELQQEIARTE